MADHNPRSTADAIASHNPQSTADAMADPSGDGFLHYNIRLMRTIGLWPLATGSRPLLLLNALYTALLVVSLALVSVCQVIEIFVSPNITSMASAVDLATLTSSALFKMVYIIWYRKHFLRLVDKINTTFVEKDFFLGQFDMSNWLKHSRMYINIYVAMGGPSLLFVFGLHPYVMSYYLARDSSGYGYLEAQMNSTTQSHELLPLEFYHQRQPPFTNTDITTRDPLENLKNIDNDDEIFAFSNRQRKFPFNCWFPFDVTWSPLYEIVYLLELVPLVGSGHLYLVSDSFFFMMIYLTCGQLELLKASFRGVQVRFEALKQKEDASEGRAENINTRHVGSPKLRGIYSKEKRIENEMNEALIKCINFHSNLVQIITDLDSLLRSMVLVDFVHAVISLSFAMLQTITSNTLFEWFQMCMFIGICILHQFLNNYFGEILSLQQLSVTEAVYETPWVDSTDLHKVAVYMTLNQANHPTRLSGWRMYHLGLSTFVEFMKLLASYFLVLQSLHADESRSR